MAVQLFASSQLESEDFYKMEDLANHMGLFLQKTNIIRDYLEDITEEPAPRCLTSHCTSCMSVLSSRSPAVCTSWHPVIVASVCTTGPVCGKTASIYVEFLSLFGACLIDERIV